MAMQEAAVRESFRNPTTRRIRASEWLLLYTIHNNSGVCSDEIQRKLKIIGRKRIRRFRHSTLLGRLGLALLRNSEDIVKWTLLNGRR